MFERFTDEARQVVVLAQERAREHGAGAIGTEHLLLALYRVPDNPALAVLGANGVDRDAVETDVDALREGYGPADAEALATLGIDLDEVRRQVDDAFGPGALDRTRSASGKESWWKGGHLGFERASKKVLELALREAMRLEHGYIGTEHILLGLLQTEGAAQRILLARGLRVQTATAMVDGLVRSQRAS